MSKNAYDHKNAYYPSDLILPRITAKEIDANLKLTTEMKKHPHSEPPKKAIWFLPHFDHCLRGGIRTILNTAQDFSRHWNTENIIVIDNCFNRASKDIRAQLDEHMPDLQCEIFDFTFDSDPATLPEADIGICTLWNTAYTLARYNKCHAKFYMMQDYEPMFYPGDSIYAAIEQTYRLGFYCIANTVGVGREYLRYSKWVCPFTPGIDKDQFSPSQESVKTKPPYQIVFYGRPNRPRNSFMLGIEALRKVKLKLKDDVHIISVGQEFPSLRYDLHNYIEIRGLLKTMDEVSDLYRKSDLGVSFMVTPHPSYQPIEYMASGCPALSNYNEGAEWLFKNGENVVLTEPIVEVAAERILNTLDDSKLREKVIQGGLETVDKLSWDDAHKTIRDFVANPKPYDGTVSSIVD